MSCLGIAQRSHFLSADRADDMRVPESPFVVAPTPEHLTQLTAQPVMHTARAVSRKRTADRWPRWAEHFALTAPIALPKSSHLTALESRSLDALALERLNQLMIKNALRTAPITDMPTTAV